MSERIRAFDVARGMAIIGVVVMHNTLAETYTPAEIWLGALLHNLCVVGVPTFLFLSGYFVASDRQPSFAAFMRRKLDRVLVPAWIWTIAFWALLGLAGSDHELDPAVLPGRLIWLSEPGHYYFVFVLMLLYAWGYWLRRHDYAVARRITWAALVLNVLVVAGYELAIWLAAPGQLPATPMYRNPLAWCFFFAYGLLVARDDRNLRGGAFGWVARHPGVAIALAAVLWLISSAETVGLFFKQTPGGQDYFKLVSFGYELIGLHLLVLAAQRLADRPAIGSALALLGRYSFFIYLIHLPLAPKLFEAIAGHSALAASLPLKMLARGLICIALPIGLALSFQLLGSGTRLTRRIGQTLGIPV